MNGFRAGFALASVLLVSAAECQAESWGRGEREYSGYEDRGEERAGGGAGRGAKYGHRGWDRSARPSREEAEEPPRGVEPYEALRRDSYSDDSRMGYRPPGRGPEQGYYNQGGNQWDRRGPPEVEPREWSAEPGGYESPRSWSRGRNMPPGGMSAAGYRGGPGGAPPGAPPRYGDDDGEQRHRAHGPSRFMGGRDEGGWGGNPFGFGGGGAVGRNPGRGHAPAGYAPEGRYASGSRGGWGGGGREGGGEEYGPPRGGQGGHGGHGHSGEEGGYGAPRGEYGGGMRGGYGESRSSRGYGRGY